MAVTVVRVAGSSINGSTSLTYSIDATGGDGMSVSATGANTTAVTVTGVTYAGAALTLADHQLSPNGFCDAWLGYKVAPATGSNSVVVTCSASGVITSGAAVLVGLAPTSTIGTPAKANGTGVTPTINVTDSVTGDLVIDVAMAGSGFTAMGAGQTGIMSAAGWINVTNNTQGDNGAASYESGGGTVTMSWTIASDSWAIVAAAFKQAAGGLLYPKPQSRPFPFTPGSPPMGKF